MGWEPRFKAKELALIKVHAIEMRSASDDLLALKK
jgi:hypothetical protein